MGMMSCGVSASSFDMWKALLCSAQLPFVEKQDKSVDIGKLHFW
jgi:hypothetical protein